MTTRGYIETLILIATHSTIEPNQTIRTGWISETGKGITTDALIETARVITTSR